MQRSSFATTLGSFPSPGLKRSRDGELPQLKLPPLPDLVADLILQIFIHKSLRPPNASKPEEYNDSERLAQLGEKVLMNSVTLYLFQLRPMLMVEEMQTRREKLMSNETIEAWVNVYDMRKRIRCPEHVRAELDTPEEGRNVFCAYVGAVYSHSGQRAVNMWIHMLIKYHEQQQQSSSGDVMMDPPAKKIKNENLYSPSLIPFAARSSSSASSASSQSSQTYTSPSLSPSASQGSQTYAPRSLSPSSSQSSQTYSPTSPYLNTSQSYSGVPARQLPPHMNNGGTQQPFQTFSSLLKSLQPLLQQSAQSMGDQTGGKRQSAFGARSSQRAVPFPPSKPNPLAPATPNAPFLPMFNQTAAQRGVKVEYPADYDGPAHARVWTARCVVNGITKGEGKGGSKQVAKEEAARQAYYAMGWT